MFRCYVDGINWLSETNSPYCDGDHLKYGACKIGQDGVECRNGDLFECRFPPMAWVLVGYNSEHCSGDNLKDSCSENLIECRDGNLYNCTTGRFWEIYYDNDYSCDGNNFKTCNESGKYICDNGRGYMCTGGVWRLWDSICWAGYR